MALRSTGPAEGDFSTQSSDDGLHLARHSLRPVACCALSCVEAPISGATAQAAMVGALFQCLSTRMNGGFACAKEAPQ